MIRALATICLCCAALIGCYRHTPTETPQPRSEVRVRLSPAADLWSVSQTRDTLILRSVRSIQARIGSARGDTLLLIAPGDYTGAGGRFILDRGRSIRVIRGSGVTVERAQPDLVEAGLATGVVVLTGYVAYLWASLFF